MSTISRLLSVLLLTCVFTTSVAVAHSPLILSAPDSGETLQISPKEIKLEFKKRVKLILIRLTGKTIDQKLRPDSSAESREHTLMLPELIDGNYTAAWRAMGKDGHIMKGVIKFSIHP